MGARRLPVIGVMGSGSDPHEALSAPLGRWIAVRGAHLLTGGGGGVMASVARAFVAVEERAGLSLGVLPGSIDAQGRHASKPGYPNESVEIPILTHLPLSGADGQDPRSRNHLNVLSSSVVVALPGGEGTRSEVALARRYERPVILHGPPTAFEGWPSDLPRAEALEAVARFVDACLSR